MFQEVFPGKDFGEILLQQYFRKSFGGRMLPGSSFAEGLWGDTSPAGLPKVLRRKDVPGCPSGEGLWGDPAPEGLPKVLRRKEVHRGPFPEGLWGGPSTEGLSKVLPRKEVPWKSFR